jgi:hypothetical protein
VLRVEGSCKYIKLGDAEADKGWYSSLGVDEGLTTPYRKNHLVTKCRTGPGTSVGSLEQRSQLKMDFMEMGWGGVD